VKRFLNVIIQRIHNNTGRVRQAYEQGAGLQMPDRRELLAVEKQLRQHEVELKEQVGNRLGG
jgi:hypothetical protein